LNNLDRIKSQVDALTLIEYLEKSIKQRTKSNKEFDTLGWVYDTISNLYGFNESVVKELLAQELRNMDLERLNLELRIDNENLKNVNKKM